MTELNYLTMLTAIREAVTYPSIKIAIFTGSSKRCDYITRELFEAIDEVEEQKEYVSYRCGGACTQNIVSFKNGSSIEINLITHEAKQKRYHKILYDNNIGEVVLYCILSRLESLPYDKTILKWRQ